MIHAREITITIKFFNWMTGRFTNRGKALFLYRRRMLKARKHDREGAIEDYSAVIDMTKTTPRLMAMALYNRALVYAAMGCEVDATRDLDIVLAIKEPLIRIKTEARQKLVRMKRRSLKSASKDN